MKRRIPIFATIVVAAAVATMFGLGIWQLRRADWKEGLLARYEQSQAMSSNVPWPRTAAERERSLFRWSQMLAALKVWLEHGINLREGMYK